MATSCESHCKLDSRTQQLIKCAEEGSLQEFLSLVEDTDYSITDELGITLLHHAAVNKTTTEIISHLLAKGTPVDERTRDGRTPLHECALRGNLINLILLIEAGADVYATDGQESTALHFAAQNDDAYDLVEYLLDRSISPNAKNVDGRTPLHDCAFGGNLNTMRLLIERGAHMKVETDNGMIALHYACENAHGDEMIQFLLEEGLPVNKPSAEGRTPVLSCAFRGDLRNMLLLIANGADLRAKAADGRTALHSAATNEKGADIIQYLLDNQFNVNEPTKNGVTPLLSCAFLGNISNMKLLLNNGANILARDKLGRTAIHSAASNWKGVEMVEFLSIKGIDINSTANNRAKPLHFAAANPAGYDIVKYLLASGASLDDRTNEGLTALHYCAWRGNLNIMKLLLEASCKVDAMTYRGQSALHFAAKNEKGGEMIQFLLEKGISIDRPTKLGIKQSHLVVEGET